MTVSQFGIKLLTHMVLFFILLGVPTGLAGNIYVDEWEDLLPGNLYDFVPEGGITSELWLDEGFQAQLKNAERRTRPELEQARIVLPGYMVPLDYEGDKVFRFLLVPNAGQCIHVPPPPPNQTVLVVSKAGTAMRTYSDPVIVEGRVKVQAGQTDYAETGYEIEAMAIIDFDFESLEQRVKALEENQ